MGGTRQDLTTMNDRFKRSCLRILSLFRELHGIVNDPRSHPSKIKLNVFSDQLGSVKSILMADPSHFREILGGFFLVDPSRMIKRSLYTFANCWPIPNESDPAQINPALWRFSKS